MTDRQTHMIHTLYDDFNYPCRNLYIAITKCHRNMTKLITHLQLSPPANTATTSSTTNRTTTDNTEYQTKQDSTWLQQRLP